MVSLIYSGFVDHKKTTEKALKAAGLRGELALNFGEALDGISPMLAASSAPAKKRDRGNAPAFAAVAVDGVDQGGGSSPASCVICITALKVWYHPTWSKSLGSSNSNTCVQVKFICPVNNHFAEHDAPPGQKPRNREL